MKKLLGIKITPAHSAIAIICFVVCFAVSLQIRSVLTNFGPVAQIKQMEILAQELVNANKKSQGFFEQAQEYRELLEQYQNESASQSQENAAIVERLHKMEILAGLADVKGQGVIIRMNDAASRPAGAAADMFIIHDKDLMLLLNELRNAGAEAISINGERLISTSDIRCAGNTITINGQKKVPPFEIRAIGDSTVLESAIKMPGGIWEALEYYLQVSIEKANDIIVPRYSRPIEFNHAQPMAAGEVSQ